jgi:hypothetical protein
MLKCKAEEVQEERRKRREKSSLFHFISLLLFIYVLYMKEVIV